MSAAESPERAPRRPWRRRLARAAVVLAVALVALIAAAWVWLESNAGRERLRGWVEQRAGALAGRRVQVADLDLDLLPLRLTLGGIRVAGDEGADSPLLQVERIEARIGAWGLLSRRLSIASLDVQAPVVHWDYPPSGQPPRPAPASTSGVWQVDIQELSVRDGAVEIDHRRWNLDAAMSAIDVESPPGAEGTASSGTIRIGGGGLRLRRPEAPQAAELELHDASLRYALDAGVLHLEDATIGIGASELRAGGRVVDWRSGELQVGADIDAGDIAILAGLAPSPQNSGVLSVSGILSFGEQPLGFTGSIDSPSISLAGLEASGLGASVQASAARVTVEDIRATAFGGALAGTVDVNLEAQPQVWRVEYSARSVDLAQLTASAALPGFRFVGDGNAEGRLTWTSPWRETIGGAGTLDLSLPAGSLGEMPRPGLPVTPGAPAAAAGAAAPPSLQGALEPSRPAPSLPLPVEAHAVYDIQQGTVVFRNAALMLPRNRATIVGSLDLGGAIDATVDLDSSDLRMLDRFFNQLRRFRGEQPTPQPLGLAGSGSAHVTVTGDLGAPAARGTLAADGLSVGNVAVGDFQGDLRLAGSILEVNDLRVRRDSGMASGNLRVRIGERVVPGPDYLFDVHLAGYPFAATLPRLEAAVTTTGVATGDVALHGLYGSPPIGTVDVTAADVRIGELTGFEAEAHLRLQPDEWTAAQLALQGPRGRLAAQGSWRRAEDTIQARIDGSDIDATIVDDLLGRDLQVGGSLAIQAQISGPTSAPDGAAVLRWTDASAAGVTVGSVAASIQVESGRLGLAAIGRPDPSVPAVPPPTPPAAGGGEAIELPETPTSGWVATLSADLAEPRLATLRAAGGSTLILTALAAQGYRPRADLDLEGNLTLGGSGELGDWTTWRGSATLTDLAMERPGLSLSIPDPVTLELDHTILRAGLPRLVTPAGDLQANTIIDLAAGRWVEAKASGTLALALLQIFSDDFEVGGQVELSVEAAGELQGTDVGGAFTLRDVFLRSPTLPWSAEEIGGEIELAEGRLRLVDVTGMISGRPFRADGVLPLAVLAGGASDEPATLEITVDELPLAPLWERAGALSQVVTGGNASVTATLRGQGTDWRSWQGAIDLRSLDIRFVDDLRVEITEPVSIRVGGGRLDLDEPIVLRGPGTDLTVGGALLLDPLRLDMTFRGSANLDPLNDLTGDFGIAGRSTVDLRVAGEPDSLTFDGTLQIESGLVSTPFLQPIDGIEASLTLRNRLINIDKFAGTLGALGAMNRSNVSLTGEIQLRDQGSPRFILYASIQDAQLRLMQGVRVTASADLLHEGTLESSLLSGTVSVSEAAYTVHWQSEADIVQLTGSAGAPVRNQLADNVNLDLVVSAPSDVRINNNMADIELGAQLEVRGSLTDPVLLGDATVLDGDITLFDHRYRFVRGSLEFQNPIETEPSLDILMETSIRQYLVTVAVTGSPSRGDLQVLPSSSPPLSDLQLVQLLTSGNAPDRTSTNPDDTVTFGAVGAQATSFLTRQYLGQVERGAQRVFGIDRFRVDPAVVAGSGDPTARVTVGQQVTRDLWISYTSVLGTSDEQLVTLEYQLNRSIRITAMREEDGSFGLDFRFDHRFR